MCLTPMIVISSHRSVLVVLSLPCASKRLFWMSIPRRSHHIELLRVAHHEEFRYSTLTFVITNSSNEVREHVQVIFASFCILSPSWSSSNIKFHNFRSSFESISGNIRGLCTTLLQLPMGPDVHLKPRVRCAQFA